MNTARKSLVERIRLCEGAPLMSRFAFGTWRLLRDEEGADPARVRAKIEGCLELGVTTFDHADVYGDYGCEAAFGAALADDPGLRDRIEIVSKCGIQSLTAVRPGNRHKHYDYSRTHIIASVERSLTLLQTDRLDALLLHRPSPMMEPDEIAAALGNLRTSGKIRSAGVSNFTRSQFEMVQSRLDFPLCTNQVEVSLLATTAFTDGTLDHCVERRIRPMAWSPTGGGRLFAAPPAGDAEHVGRLRATMATLAPLYDLRASEIEVLAYAFLLAHPSGMQIVLGTNKLERVRTAVGAAAINLDLQDWFALYQASLGHDVP